MAVIFLEELESAGGALLDRGGKPERPTMPWLLPGRLLFVSMKEDAVIHEGAGRVIHEGAGRVKGAVMGLGWLGVPRSVTGGSWGETFQSSIRSRWADPSVVRGSRAQSSGRPSSRPCGSG
jgi:hypothetical protein